MGTQRGGNTQRTLRQRLVKKCVSGPFQCSQHRRRMTSAKSGEDSTPSLVDMDELFLEWAQTVYETTLRRDLEKELKAKLAWQEVRVKLDYTQFFMDTEDEEHKRLRPMAASGRVVFRTTYSNTTKAQLEYTLNTQRTTRNVTTVRFSKGLAHSCSIGLKLKLPGDVCELEGGGSREISISRERETSTEEEMTWSADTQITVPPKTDMTMELVVDEKEYDGKFEAKVRLSGKVVIIISKGDCELTRIVAKKFNDILKPRHGFVYEHDSKSVYYKVEGTCMCRKGIQQSINLSEQPI